jgi:hypothetical protein
MQPEQQEAEDDRSRSRQIRAAKNQSLFREVNERVKEVGERSGSRSYAESAICECANAECSEEIALTAEEYESLRAHSTCFAVPPSDEHVFADIERILKKHENYWVVEKIEHASLAAVKLDPRKRGV